MPKLDGILETALYTDDMARAQAFYEDVLELEADLHRRAAHAPTAWRERSVLLIFKRGARRRP